MLGTHIYPKTTISASSLLATVYIYIYIDIYEDFLNQVCRYSEFHAQGNLQAIGKVPLQLFFYNIVMEV